MSECVISLFSADTCTVNVSMRYRCADLAAVRYSQYRSSVRYEWLCTVTMSVCLCRYSYCEKCFDEIVGDEVELVDDPSQPVMWVLMPLSVRPSVCVCHSVRRWWGGTSWRCLACKCCRLSVFLFVTSAKEVMFLPDFVCLSVCVC